MKTPHRHILLAIAIVAGLFTINWFNSSEQLMPEFSFTDIDGHAHSSVNYQGKPLLVIFWATDCPGCVQEMPDLIKLYQTYSPEDFSMLGIAMAHDSSEHIKAMRADRELPYTITWDESNQLAHIFGNVRVTPTHFLIAPNGEIVMRKIGSLNTKLIHNKLKAMGLNKS
ncbi:MAG: TlpA disulfide reductase family protein [Gammaproteobacteria bacterium]|nr:TlpA disulfide reductase family protein [Gammaproteobacteria bacterium]